MKFWQKLLLSSMGTGAGSVIAAALVIGVWFYIASLPEKPKPWDQVAIKATFADLFVTLGDKIVTTFQYTLENKTNSDYYFPEDAKSAFVILSEGKGLSQEDVLTWGRGVYLPCGQKISMSFHLTDDYNESYPRKERDNLDKLGEFMKSRLRKIDGFVVLDKNNRYEIIFPNGWKDRHEIRK
jgi:hypothetical protein